MVNDNLPVVMGAKEFYQNNIRVLNVATDHSRGDLAEFYKTVKDTDVVPSSKRDTKVLKEERC